MDHYIILRQLEKNVDNTAKQHRHMMKKIDEATKKLVELCQKRAVEVPAEILQSVIEPTSDQIRGVLLEILLEVDFNTTYLPFYRYLLVYLFSMLFGYFSYLVGLFGYFSIYSCGSLLAYL